MEALELLRRYADGSKLWYYEQARTGGAPIHGVVPAAWRKAVVGERGRPAGADSV